MSDETHVTETKETTVKETTVREPAVEVPKPRHGETITIETHNG